MGLMRGMARTAVIAGTATAVSNRVSRRQAGRWQQQADAQAYEEQQTYGSPPPQYAPPPAPAPAPAAAAPAGGAGGDLAAQLDQLAGLNRQGILTDAEFAAAKAKLLGI
jgi:predicted lipid-binding transport protein (Tim44 family)